MSQPYPVVFPVYPGVTQLDFTGPAQVLSRMSGAVIHVAGADRAPIATDSGFSIVPDVTFDDAPQAALICVPGGFGTTAAMADASFLDFLRRQAAGAELVTSVCTGSLILAAAGLLRGYRAACYWAWRDQLAPFGAIPSPDRVVVDRDRITGGGVTAGIDFAFRVIEHLRGRDEADLVRLLLEYDPEPLGGGGRPETARPEILERARARVSATGGEERRAAAAAAAHRLSVSDPGAGLSA